jgi:ribosome-binding factor A
MPERRVHRYPRVARINEVVREVITDELRRLDDEDLTLVTVTGVHTDPDMRRALVWLSSMSDEAAAVLQRYRPRLQRAIGRQLRMKRTPELAFEADPAIASGARVEDILRNLRKDE